MINRTEMKNNSRKVKITNLLLVLLCISGIMANKVHSQDMPVPVNLQAVLFKKILLYDETLGTTNNLIVLSDSENGDKVVEAFNAAGIPAKSATNNNIPIDARVIYVMPGTPSPAKICEDNKILSISGNPKYAENGQVSIALGIENGKPKIIVNLAKLKKEGHVLSPDLLYLSKLIK